MITTLEHELKVQGSFAVGRLDVSDGYNLYYECYGNPEGLPVLFIHGGPGAGFYSGDKQFFDPQKYNVIFFDQRGAGRSTPFASIENNSTDHLIHDINAILNHLNLPSCYILAGSWGATLALIYAIRFPERVKGLVLRGLFLGNHESINYYINGGIVSHFPDAWERFVSHVPEKHRNNVAQYYLNQMLSDDPIVRDKYTYEWAFYEFSIYKMDQDIEAVPNLLKQFSYRSLSPLEAYYMINYCFVTDNYILENAAAIKHLPISIIHGRYDFICPPRYAFQLHNKLPNSRLNLVTAGHAGSEPEIEHLVRGELARMTQS